MYLYIVLGGYLRILGAPSVLPNVYLFMADNANPDLLVCAVGPGVVSTSPTFIRSIASHPVGPSGRLKKHGKSYHHFGVFRHNLHSSFYPL